MARADVASGEQEVVDIDGIDGTDRNPVRLFRNDIRIRRSEMFESARMMVVDRPAAVCDGVIEFSAGKDIILVDDVIADISAAFPLAGQESDPVEHPVVRGS